MNKSSCIVVKQGIYCAFEIIVPQQQLGKGFDIACAADAVRQAVTAVKITAKRKNSLAAQRHEMFYVTQHSLQGTASFPFSDEGCVQVGAAESATPQDFGKLQVGQIAHMGAVHTAVGMAGHKGLFAWAITS